MGFAENESALAGDLMAAAASPSWSHAAATTLEVTSSGDCDRHRRVLHRHAVEESISPVVEFDITLPDQLRDALLHDLFLMGRNAADRVHSAGLHREDLSSMATIHRGELAQLCKNALLSVGAGQRAAQVLADATVEAELIGNRAVGVAHLFDYLDSYQNGRIAKDASPVVRRAASAVIEADARDGLAQTAFAAAFDDLQAAAREAGIAALWIRNSYTCGELGYYPRHLATRGFIALALANSPALMSLGGASKSILGTNPLAYAIPRPGKLPVVIDQASSSTAFVNIRHAAEAGETIPAGWALGPDGEQTQDAHAALQGTLLPFGSHRGGNIALLVEILATLSGASFSLEAAPFDRGNTSPGIGVFLLAIDPANFAGSIERLARQLESLRDDHQVRLPAVEITTLPESVEISSDILGRLRHAVKAAYDPA